MLETCFWCQNQRFVVWLIIWDHFQKPQIDLKANNWVQLGGGAEGGQEWDVGGPEPLQRANFQLCL